MHKILHFKTVLEFLNINHRLILRLARRLRNLALTAHIAWLGVLQHNLLGTIRRNLPQHSTASGRREVSCPIRHVDLSSVERSCLDIRRTSPLPPIMSNPRHQCHMRTKSERHFERHFERQLSPSTPQYTERRGHKTRNILIPRRAACCVPQHPKVRSAWRCSTDQLSAPRVLLHTASHRRLDAPRLGAWAERTSNSCAHLLKAQL